MKQFNIICAYFAHTTGAVLLTVLSYGFGLGIIESKELHWIIKVPFVMCLVTMWLYGIAILVSSLHTYTKEKNENIP